MQDGIISKEVVELCLTQDDYRSLLAMIGFAMGASMKDGGLSDRWKEVSDWIVIQGDATNYCYFHDKDILRARKLDELGRFL